MLGISEEKLREIRDGFMPQNREYACLVSSIIAECKELNPWLTIDKHGGGGGLVNIGKHNGVVFEWIQVAYLCEGLWFLPFDSERDENGTPYLGEDDKPTHYQELPADPK